MTRNFAAEPRGGEPDEAPLLDTLRGEFARLGEQLRRDVREELRGAARGSEASRGSEYIPLGALGGRRPSSIPIAARFGITPTPPATRLGVTPPATRVPFTPPAARVPFTPPATRLGVTPPCFGQPAQSGAPPSYFNRGHHQWCKHHFRRFVVEECEKEVEEFTVKGGWAHPFPARARSSSLTSATTRRSSKSVATVRRDRADTQHSRPSGASVDSTSSISKVPPSHAAERKEPQHPHLPGSMLRAEDVVADGIGDELRAASPDVWAAPGTPPDDDPMESPGGTSSRGTSRDTRRSERRSRSPHPHFKVMSEDSGMRFTKKAMALTSMSRLGTTDFEEPANPLVERIVRSLLFEQIMMVFIFINCITAGTQIDYMITNQLTAPPPVYRAIDVLFCGFFIVELALRVYVHRMKFFFMWGWGWNVMDLVLVVTQILEEILVAATDANVPSSMVLRITRVLKCIRIVRIMRVMRFAEDLRLLVTCILYSVRSFVWALSFLFLVIYIYGIYLTHSVHLYRLEHTGESSDDKGSAELLMWYGSITRASLSLFQALTGGVDWNDIVKPLIEHLDPVWGLSTVLWIAFSTLAVLNIITGTFVQNAIEQAAGEKEKNRVTRARKLFRCLDLDNSGRIGREEIERHLDSPAVQDFFRVIDVATSEAQCVFDLLDCSGDGYIDFEEFLSGCIRLQGQARALDMILLILDTRHAFEQQEAMMIDIRAALAQIEDSLESTQDKAPPPAPAPAASSPTGPRRFSLP